MISKHYHGIQLCLCIATTALLFYFTIPWALQNGKPYERKDRLSKIAEQAMRAKAESESPLKIASADNKPQYVSAPKSPPVVKIEKSWDDHLATLAHLLEAFSPLSTLAMSVILWRRKRREKL